MSSDAQVDSWTGQFLKPPIQEGSWTELGFGRGRLLKSPAPGSNLPGPQLTTLRDSNGDGRRQLDLRLDFAPGTQLIWLTVNNARVLGAAVEGKPVTGFSSTPENPQDRPPSQDKDWLLMYANPPASGLHLHLEMETVAAPVIRVFQDSELLPALPGFMPEPRPSGMMPTPIWPPLDSSAVVARTFRHFEVSSETGPPPVR
jgi:hypothetical protein